MIDAGGIVYQLLTADIPTATIRDEVAVTTIDELPTIIYAISGPGQTANGDGYWNVILDLTVIDDIATGFDIASAADDAVHSWPGRITGLGWVHDVTDVALFSTVTAGDRQSVPVAGRDVVHYAGTFALALRK